MAVNQYDAITVSPSKAVKCLQKVFEAGLTAMLWGSYGIGKTSIVYQITEALKEKAGFEGMIVINPSQDDVIDFKLPWVDKDEVSGECISRFAISERLPRHGKWVVFVDEINTCTQAMQATLYSLILEGRIGEYQLPDGCIRVAAGNREFDKCAAQPMAAALKDRLALHLNIVPNEDDWCRWASRNNVVPELISYVRNFPHCLSAGQNPDDPTGGCTPRSLAQLSRLMQTGIPRDVEHIIFNGTIGHARGTELAGFMEMYREKIDLDRIFQDPLNEKVPDQNELLFSLAVGLGTRCKDAKDVDHVAQFVKKIDPTYQVVFIKTLSDRNLQIANTKYYRDFITKYFQLIAS